MFLYKIYIIYYNIYLNHFTLCMQQKSVSIKEEDT